MKAGFTIDACPGCGERNERKKKDVCPDCIGLLATARDFKKKYEELKNKGDNIECSVPFGWDGPKFYSSRSLLNSNQSDILREAFIRLSQLVSIPQGMTVSFGYMQYLDNQTATDYSNSGWHSNNLPVVYLRNQTPGNKQKLNGQGTAIMPREIYDCLCDLADIVSDTLKTTEEKAVEFGKNTLLMLNSGKLTIEEFNQK